MNICGLLDGTPIANVLIGHFEGDLERQIHGWFASRGDIFVRDMLAAVQECGWGSATIPWRLPSCYPLTCS